MKKTYTIKLKVLKRDRWIGRGTLVQVLYTIIR